MSTLTLPVFASEENPDLIYAHSVPELLNITFDEIDSLSDSELDFYFEKGFSVSANNYTHEEKLTVVKSLSVVEQHQSMMRAISTTGECPSYGGATGLSWVRDTSSGHSPLTMTEALSGTFTLEVGYATYKSVATLIAASSSLNIYNSLKNASSTAVASAIICNQLNLNDLIIPSAVVSIVVSMGWDVLNALDRTAMNAVFQRMSLYHLMKITYTTYNNTLTKSYSLYAPPSYNYNEGSDIITYRNIENPYPGLWGFWYPHTYAYLYSNE